MLKRRLSRGTFISDEQANTYLVHKGVAPGVAVGPGAADQPAGVVVPAFAPVAPLDEGDQAHGGVAHFHLAVLAGGPEHREAVLVVLNAQRELAVIVVDLPNAGRLVVVYREHVPVVRLRRTEMRNNYTSASKLSQGFILGRFKRVV